MALAYSSPVTVQLQQSLAASRAGGAASHGGVSWASSFASVRLIHSAQMKSGALFSLSCLRF